MSEKFWAVWREAGGSTPNKRHTTKDSAVFEAGRLSKQSGERYFILEVVGVVAPIHVPIEYTDIPY